MTRRNQRMVPMELLRKVMNYLSCCAEQHVDDGYDPKHNPASSMAKEICAIIDGPEVEPVAAAVLSYNAATDWYDVISADHNILRPLCKKHAQGMATLYSSPSASSTSVRAVPDGAQLVPKKMTQEMLDANSQPMSTEDWWAATLAAAPQPPVTAQPSTVACPLVNDPEGRN